MKIAVFSLLTLCAAAPAFAATHEVKMYNRNENGPMIYEPQFLKIAPGDSVRFIPTQPENYKGIEEAARAADLLK